MTNDHAQHPGGLLRQTLDALGMSQAELARQTRLTTKHINQVCQAEASISPRSAVLLEEATGVGADLWLRMQAAHDLTVARAARVAELATWQAKRAAAASIAVELVRQAES